MQLHLVRHAWGAPVPAVKLVPLAKAEGYQAVETSILPSPPRTAPICVGAVPTREWT